MNIRNVAIIAHVDHGKTTLVDSILRQTGVFRQNEAVQERVMDSNDLERERGITILAKNTAVFYNDVKINIVDTPGHADFGGEVERILSMVDGALLIVDAAEGPLPQTRFVLSKALEQKLKPIVMVNKIDRPDARVEEVVDEILDLFISLGADDEQIEFPVLYGAARRGFASPDLEEARAILRGEKEGNIHPLLDAIIRYIPAPAGEENAPLQFQATTLDYDDYLGRIAIGRVHAGKLQVGHSVGACLGEVSTLRPVKISQVFTFQGLARLPIQEAVAGDIIAVAGIEDITLGETITDFANPAPLPPLKVDEPTLTMTFRVNDSPFAGREGTFLTSRHLRDRLYKEARTNVALRIRETESPDAFEVSGRGELHLSILIETMRREGYELAVSRPQVIYKVKNGQRLEPLEYLVIDVPQEYMGAVIEKLGKRRAELQNMHPVGQERVKLEFVVPARGLIGFNSEFMTETKGYGIMHQSFYDYGPDRGPIPGRNNGVLVAWESGPATSYAIGNIQERGILFVDPGTEVYEGMIVGENSREDDIDVNLAKKKHVTNLRSSTSDIAIKLDPPRRLSLEEALAYIADDELVEVTPQNIRLRKRILDRKERARLRGQEIRAMERND